MNDSVQKSGLKTFLSRRVLVWAGLVLGGPLLLMLAVLLLYSHTLFVPDVAAHAVVDLPDEQNAFTLYRETHRKFQELGKGSLFQSHEEREAQKKAISDALETTWNLVGEDIRKWLEKKP